MLRGKSLRSNLYVASGLAALTLFLAALASPAQTIPTDLKNWHSQPVNLGPNVNSPFDDYAPSVTADGTKLLFTSRRPGGFGRHVRPQDHLVEASEDFWMCLRGPQGWQPAFHLDRPINSEEPEGAASIASDGQRIYYTRCFQPDGFGHCDIYVSDLHGTEWGEPQNLGPAVNTASWEAHPSISSDGRTLFFAREDSIGGFDIWESTLTDTGWSEAVRLPETVNSPYAEGSPFIHADGVTLYFASNRPGGYGGFDLYVSRKTENGWSPAVNLGPWINTEGDEKYLTIPGMGNKAYFASSRPGGFGDLDLYEVEIPLEMRPKPVTTVKGLVLDVRTRKPIEAEIVLRYLDTGEIAARTTSNSSTGNYLVVLPSARKYSVLARAGGYVDFSDKYEIPIQKAYKEIVKDILLHPARTTLRISRQIVDSETGQPIPALVVVKRLSEDKVIGRAYADETSGLVEIEVPIGQNLGLTYKANGYVYTSESLSPSHQDSFKVVKLTKVQPKKPFQFRVNLIFFDFNSDRLKPESTADLQEAVRLLQEYPELKIEIQGHTDSVGPEDYNLALSKRRAEAVKRYLVEHGISPERLVTRGYGESRPVAPNDTETNRRKNRRVEFKVLNPPTTN